MIISKNISELRKSSGLTQLELAEKLNYTDKAVSKWERGESVPDISVLKNIADLLNVTVDYLITEHQEAASKLPISTEKKRKNGIYKTIILMSIFLVWFLATGGFVLFYSAFGFYLRYALLSFLFAVPISCIVWLVLNSVWFHGKNNYFIISLLMWALIASLHLSFLAFQMHAELLYLVGIPGQAIIIIWAVFSKRKKMSTFNHNFQ